MSNLASHSGLDHLIEVELLEEQYDATKIYELDQIISNFSVSGYEIVKHRASFKQQLKGTSALYENSQQLEDLKPRDVFLKLMDQQENEENRDEILSAFDEILEEVRNPLDR